jgi:hypothetical protein
VVDDDDDDYREHFFDGVVPVAGRDDGCGAMIIILTILYTVVHREES